MKADVDQKSSGVKADLAGREINRLGDQTATREERARRKRRLIKGPREFRDIQKLKPALNRPRYKLGCEGIASKRLGSTERLRLVGRDAVYPWRSYAQIGEHYEGAVYFSRSRRNISPDLCGGTSYCGPALRLKIKARNAWTAMMRR
jgi:hypothetical protein